MMRIPLPPPPILAAAFLVLTWSALAQNPASEGPGDSTTEAESSTGAEPGNGGVILVGKIDGEISLSESAYIKRLLEAARLAEAEVVAIELNTFGGRVDAAVAIRDALLDAPYETVVFINKRAISAGALISFACDKVVMSSGGTIGAATPVVAAPGQQTAQPVEEKYVSYFRQEMRSTAEANGRDGDIAEAMVDADFEIEGLSEKGKLLTLDTKGALVHGIADLEAASLEEALDALGFIGPVRKKERTWAEALAAFLTSQAIASLLFTAMMVMGYMEIQTPGFGVFGSGAIVCFLLVFYGHYLVNLAGWEELLLFGIGLILIAVEIFVLPGFGIAGVAGAVAILASAVLVFQAGDWSSFSLDNPFSRDAMARVLFGTVAGLALIGVMVRYVSLSPSSPVGRRLVLNRTLATADGFTSHTAPSEGLVGELGTTVTPLRPSGKVLVGGKRRDAESEGDHLPKDVAVRVLRYELGQLVVRRVEETSEMEGENPEGGGAGRILDA